MAFKSLKICYLLFVNYAILFLWSNEVCWGQDLIYFDHITTNDGLSQSDINSIYQDKQGFMWFGTHDGLNRYDGYGFTVFKPNANNSASITSNLIYAITGDEGGNLWIGTTGSGLNYFDRTTETFLQYKNEKDNNSSLSNDHVTKVFKDSKNRLWVGTNKGLNMLDLNRSKDTISFQRFNPEQEPFITGWDGNAIYDIFEDSKNQLWVGGFGGLYKLSRDESGAVYFRLVNKSMGLPNVHVRCLGEDKLGRLVIGTNEGLFTQKNINKTIGAYKIHDGTFNDIQIDLNNNIWAGNDNGLLYFENFGKDNLPKLVNKFNYDSRFEYSLSKNIVKSLFMDHTGIIWVGTNGGGVNKFDPERKQFLTIRKTLDPNSLSYDKIRSMYEDSNGSLWIGTEGGGLNMLKKEDDNGDYNNFQVFNKISKPFALLEVSQKDTKSLFIGAESSPGLFQLNITNPQKINSDDIIEHKEIDHSVFALLEDSKWNIWIGTYGGGVFRWMPKSGLGNYDKVVFEHDPVNTNSISSDIIRNIFEDKEGNIWFATGDGLCKLSKEESTKKQPKFRIYKNEQGNPNTISHNYILSLYESSNGIFWVGTFGGGLNRFIPSNDENKEKFVSYSEADGLPNNVIKGILEDEDGNLWLSTNQGLSRFNPKEKTFKNFDVNDGLQSNEFQELACLKRKNGEMLFGGINGFNTFFPKNIKENTYEPETVITDFLISNKTVEIGKEMNGRPILKKTINETKEIKLKYKENSFSFEFAALHFAAPGKNKFAYMLEGFDEDWIQTSSNKRFATYTNLAPGAYTLKVKASN
ncbi:MAG: two-component regulator propeller domain-containing protein, partial [Maribacter sp.]